MGSLFQIKSPTLHKSRAFYLEGSSFCSCYLNITPPEMVSVYGKGRMSVSPSSIVTNTEWMPITFRCTAVAAKLSIEEYQQ